MRASFFAPAPLNIKIKAITKHVIYCIFVLMIVFFSVYKAHAQASEYIIKAALLERFTHFTSWPHDSLVSNSSGVFYLTVLGKNPFNDLLHDFYKNKKMKNRKVEIMITNDINEALKNTHLLFISSSMERKIDDIIKYTRNLPILTISDTKRYGNKGVIVNMYVKDKSVKFEVNMKALKQSGLSIHYMMLRLGRLIE